MKGECMYIETRGGLAVRQTGRDYLEKKEVTSSREGEDRIERGRVFQVEKERYRGEVFRAFFFGKGRRRRCWSLKAFRIPDCEELSGSQCCRELHR